MKFLDLRTIYFIAGMLYLLMPLVVWVALREQKSRVVMLWCLGGELFGIALLLLAMRNQLPDIITYELANLLIILGNVTRIQSLATELRKPLSRVVFIAIPFACTSLYAFSRFLYPDEIFHFVLITMALSALLGWMANLSRELAFRDQSTSARILEGIYLAFVLVLFLRTLEVIAGWSEKGLFTNNLIATSMAIMGVIAAVLGNASFLGMFVERSVRERLLAAQQQARREENDRLGRQIAHLDRQRAIGMLSSSLNHELSQPLTNMRLLANHAELEVRREGNPDSSYARFIEGIQRNLDFAMAIVDRVRGFVKSDIVEYRVLSLQELNTNVLAILGDWLRSESVDIRVEQPNSPVNVRGDPVQLSQILVNIYRNAVQASAGQSQRILAITIGRSEDQGSVRVQDNGPGFSEQALGQAGTPFYTTKVDGLGIGLSIVRNIIGKHHGELSVSNGASGGAIVEVRLPLC